MFSRKSKIVATAAAVLMSGGVAATIAASSASAAPLPPRVHHACAYNLNGGNVLDLNLSGTDYKYPVLLHVGDNGLVVGLLYDKYLPGTLQVRGLCIGDNVAVGVNYPGGQTLQGSRVENMIISPVSPHRGTVAGVWDETGKLAESGTASLLGQVHRF